ncbi:hypothetical protein FRC0337_00764 [Corynebacterium diphtheriae]|nr:hypothetical protein CIP107504_00875 [Corynebacterium diphtheriae]CAB0641958.1 hypothetical protein CIP107560_00875 [Corynebacterium diphtheriae]CAB0642013.1 hypothetical protein CIP107576_00873 [Corynebacterium diphtheriae]CAB0684862.1 hypothetical protein FRC0031_00655 [Corynebacterium diphtheriae]CAB0684965.1 hypothetical protein FRC0038_00659 [Corynebacterium diphtheriae]
MVPAHFHVRGGEVSELGTRKMQVERQKSKSHYPGESAWHTYQRAVKKAQSAATELERQTILRSARHRYWTAIGKIHKVAVDTTREPVNPAKVHPITGQRRQFSNSRFDGTPGRKRNIKNVARVRRIG